MKKIVAGLLLASVLVVSIGSVMYVSADPGTPPGFGGQGGWSRNSQGALPGDGWMHDEMVTAMADELGMTVEELEKEIASGNTPAQIASEKGMTVVEFREMIIRVREEAIDLAVKNGTLTQEQADWLKTRGNRGQQMADRSDRDGWLHNEMVTVLAKEFGLTVEELEALLDEGKTYAQIASDKGMTVTEFRVLMVKARGEAIDLAVENGTLTQEQADWMKSRTGMGRGGRGSGAGAGGSAPFWQQNQ